MKKADYTVTKIYPSGYRAWKRINRKYSIEEGMIVYADGDSIIEAEKRLKEKLFEIAKRDLRKLYEKS